MKRTTIAAAIVGAAAAIAACGAAITFISVKTTAATSRKQAEEQRNATSTPYVFRIASLEMEPPSEIKASDQDDLQSLMEQTCNTTIPNSMYQRSRWLLIWYDWLVVAARYSSQRDLGDVMTMDADQRNDVDSETPSAVNAACKRANDRYMVAYALGNPLPITVPQTIDRSREYNNAYQGAFEGARASERESGSVSDTP